MIDVYDRIASSSRFRNSVLIFSGFDSYAPTNDQIADIHSLQTRYPTAVINYLLKISKNIDETIEAICNTQFLDEIKVIGLTEKELGCTVKDRLKALIAVKEALKFKKWEGHIHIFGGLDPVLSKLYYYAGADIFDGLSWQRIRYSDLSSLFHPSHYRISLSEEENKFWMMVSNLSELHKMKDNLSVCATDRDAMRKKLMGDLDNSEISFSDILNDLEE